MVFKYNFAKAVSYANAFSNKKDYLYSIAEEYANAGFVSQCVNSGCDLKFTCKDWFYKNDKEFSKSWGDLDELLKFLVGQNHAGPFGRISNIQNVSVGDVVFFEKNDKIFDAGILTKFNQDEIFYRKNGSTTDEKLDIISNEIKYIFVHILGVKKI